MQTKLNSIVITFITLSLALSSIGVASEVSEPVPFDLPTDSPFVKDGRLDVEAAVKYFEDLYRSTSSISQVTMTVTKPRTQRTMGMKVWTRGQERSLILIQAPQREKGTATLKVETNLWNYLPKIKRTIRIPPSMMLASWMGSDFTNDDLVRESSLSKDYIYQLVGPVQDPNGWQLRFDARPDMVGLWNRIDLILSPNGTIPLKADYYDRKDQLSRTIVWSDVRQFGEKRIPATMTLRPKDKKGYLTEMIYTSIDFEADVPEAMFSLSQLERLR